MKKIMILTIAAIMVFALSACKGEEKSPVKDNPEVLTETAPTVETEKEDAPDGIQEDGKGKVIPLTVVEKAQVLEQTTETWLAMSADEKDAMVVLIGRWWEDNDGIVVEDYDVMGKVIDHQMEQYHKNGVNENLFNTVCEIYDVDNSTYITK